MTFFVCILIMFSWFRLQIDDEMDDGTVRRVDEIHNFLHIVERRTHTSHWCFEFNHDGNYFHFRNQLIPVHDLLSFPFHPLISSIQPPGYEDLTKTTLLACFIILPSVRHPHLISTTLIPLSLPSICQITTKHPNTENTE